MMGHRPGRLRHALHALTAAALVLAGLTACGGSGNGDPLSNPPLVTNAPGASGQSTLSYAYFQRCINPVFLEPLPITLNGVATTNSCSNAGCHANATGSGGAFRIIASATPLVVADPANGVTGSTTATIQASDMYKNFISAEGEVVVNTPAQSLIVEKPLLLNVQHGGGRIFASEQDPHVKLLEYWISHPTPAGTGEFDSSSYSQYFVNADPNHGACLSD
jgi:predicted small lipoprotein YifL